MSSVYSPWPKTSSTTARTGTGPGPGRVSRSYGVKGPPSKTCYRSRSSDAEGMFQQSDRVCQSGGNSMMPTNDEVIARLAAIETLLATLVEQRTVKEWYSTAEVASILGR